MSGHFHINAGEPNSKMSNFEEEKRDTDADSWDSGANQPDFFDQGHYDENDPSDDDHLTDEGDEDNLGDMSDEEFRAKNAGVDLGMGGSHRFSSQLDDTYYKDRTFDCD